MCEPTTIAVVAGAAIVGGGIMQQRAASKAGDRARQEGQLKKASAYKQAENIKRDAIEKVKKIRAQAIILQGMQIAEQAASGAIIGDGSTQAAIDRTISLSEQDALATLYTAKNKADFVREGGDISMFEADARADSMKKQGTASLLSSFGSAGMGAAGFLK